MNDDWTQIKDFPNYAINKTGDIININTSRPVRQSRTQHGVVKVNLTRDGKQETRSVKVLVALTFVKGLTDEFDTPIHLDNNQDNNHYRNLAWRPRWFAWKYARQFVDMSDIQLTGPILEVTTGIVYPNIVAAATKNGLLFVHIWRSIRNDESTFPNGLDYALIRKSSN